MARFKQVIKKKIIAHPKGAWLFGAYKRDGMRGVIIEIAITALIKSGISNKHYAISQQAVFLYEGSKHLNFIEKMLVSKKWIKSANPTSSEKKLLKKGILPIEEI